MEQPGRHDAAQRKGARRLPLGFAVGLVIALTALALAFVGCCLGPLLLSVLDMRPPGAVTQEQADAAWRAHLAATPRPEPERAFTVAVYADEEYRERPGWRETARSSIADASEIYARELRLVFEVVSIGEWQSADDAPSLLALERDARDLVGPGSDLVVVLVGQRGPAGAYHDYIRGYAPYFRRLALVRPNAPGETWFYERETIAHEFGHLFGAWHSTVQTSLMRADKYGPERFVLDDRSREVIGRVAQLDVTLGIGALDDGAERDVTRAFAADYFCFDEHPLAYSLVHRAYRRMLRGDDASAIRADLRRARPIRNRFRSRWGERTRERLDALRAFLDGD